MERFNAFQCGTWKSTLAEHYAGILKFSVCKIWPTSKIFVRIQVNFNTLLGASFVKDPMRHVQIYQV